MKITSNKMKFKKLKFKKKQMLSIKINVLCFSVRELILKIMLN